ncbi:hypothetical protein FWK35_00036180 [Aphis craccivora]|uniref:Uncharacterized protein n=1 Tax=Aphis craccivora TaxID=307492 RepID=A0A6G0YTI9_APHCR|nr:hypothetical protein FWK35_00036180 [Aphis craccivora]
MMGMCFFFVSDTFYYCRKNASIFNFDFFSGLKIKIVGLLGVRNKKILCAFNNNWENE